jgi:Aldo/keto reductase family
MVKRKDTRLLNRRDFNGLCAAFSSFASLSGASVIDAATAEMSTGTGRTVKFQDGTTVPALGLGSAGLGQGRHPAAAEEEALRTGIALGMTLIDTSGDYGGGRSEELIGRAIAGQRDRVFLVSKVEANQVNGDGIARACDASLARLGTNYLDLYLLHWPVPSTKFSLLVAGVRTFTRGGEDSCLGRVQLLSPPDGRPLPYPAR